jgi:chloride channel protein, CIC family
LINLIKAIFYKKVNLYHELSRICRLGDWNSDLIEIVILLNPKITLGMVEIVINKNEKQKVRRTIVEESVLLVSVIKWIVLASCTGVLVGLGATAFLSLLSWATNTSSHYRYTFLLLPVAFFLSSLLTKYLAPDAEGHGTEKVIEAIHKHSSRIPLAVVPVKLLATIITLAIGGSAGKEGPCAQIWAGISAFFARVLNLDENDRRKLVICGISAGFATVFGTPIAGSIFGVEVLFVGSLLYEVLLPSFIAGVTAYQVSSFFEIPYLHSAAIPMAPINEALLLKVILSGIVFGVISALLIVGLRLGRKLSDKFRVWSPMKGLIGGGFLVLLALAFGDQYLGLGMKTISLCLNGQPVPWDAPLLKIIFTAVTLNFGGSGGIVTPIFFIGSTTGSLIAQVLHLDSAVLSAIGFVSLLAGAANTPIAASIMAVEMFGPSIGPYAAVACIVSYLVTGHRSVYPSQVLAVKKSSSLNAEMGQEMHAVQASYQKRNKTISGLLFTLLEKVNEKWQRRGRRKP